MRTPFEDYTKTIVELDGDILDMLSKKHPEIMACLNAKEIKTAEKYQHPKGPPDRFILVFPGTKYVDCDYFDRHVDTDEGVLVVLGKQYELDILQAILAG